MSGKVFTALVELLLLNANELDWGIKRVEDEFGIELSAGIEAAANIGLQTSSMNMRDIILGYKLTNEEKTRLRNQYGIGLSAGCGVGASLGGYSSVV